MLGLPSRKVHVLKSRITNDLRKRTLPMDTFYTLFNYLIFSWSGHEFNEQLLLNELKKYNPEELVALSVQDHKFNAKTTEKITNSEIVKQSGFRCASYEVTVLAKLKQPSYSQSQYNFLKLQYDPFPRSIKPDFVTEKNYQSTINEMVITKRQTGDCLKSTSTYCDEFEKIDVSPEEVEAQKISATENMQQNYPIRYEIGHVSKRHVNFTFCSKNGQNKITELKELPNATVSIKNI